MVCLLLSGKTEAFEIYAFCDNEMWFYLKNKFLLGCSDCTGGHKCLKITFKILSEIMNFFKYSCLLIALSEFVGYLNVDFQLDFML